VSGPVIHMCEQGTAEWFDIRKGLATSSEFKCILKGPKGYSQTRRTYMLQLAAERVTGQPPENFFSIYTERGKLLEPEARNLYAMIQDAAPQQVGFITNHGAGSSTDSLVGESGVLEIKTKKAGDLIEVLLADEFCPEHVAQCQGALWITEREWIDLCVYWPGMPPFIKRAYRDEDYIANLASEVAKFNEELAGIVERINAYGAPALSEAA
jgi:hypothetical protein